MGLLNAFFRAVVAIFVVAVGLLTTVAVGVVTALFFLIRRQRTPAERVAGKQARNIPRSAGDVIDVTVTEVPER